MKNFKVKTYLMVATLIAIGCQPVMAANLKENPIINTKATTLSHQEILNYLLTADMALQRNMPEVALKNYILVAKYTRDPEVAQLATELSVQLQDEPQALIASEIWASAAPNNLQAQLVAVTLYVNSNTTKTVEFLTNAFNTKEPNIDQHLLLIISKLSPTGQKNLTDAVFKIANQQKDNPYVQLAAAQLSAVQLNTESAAIRVKLALNLKPDLTSAIELNAKLIRHQQNNDKPALAYLDQQVKTYPKNGELRLFYITALIDNKAENKAIPQLEILSKDATYGGEALLTLGEIYINKNNYSLAEKSITKALAYPNSADKANYYLAQLAEQNNKTSQAVTFYQQVGENSEYHVPSFLRAAYLYSLAGDYTKALSTLQNSTPTTFYDQKQILLTEIDIMIDAHEYDQALDSCNSTLAVIPDDVDFLYARSVVYGLLQKNADAEKDLRAILAIDPNNANALNALGFTLSNQPTRMAEAMPLLEKALNLNPDNPAFMDSMGWLLYKMGKNKESIAMLAKAYKLSGDNEIAAHYGEVLWASGNKESAISVWKQALIASPENPQAIHATLNKLNISLAVVNTAKSGK